MKADTLIWLDGHTTSIATEEAYRKSYSVPTDNGSEWRMKIDTCEFVWKGNCWMQLP